jgi:hypothetical protein
VRCEYSGRESRLFLAGSAIVVLLLYAAAYVFPGTWGGPNVLSGLLLLGGYVGMGIGLILVLAAARKRRRHSPRDSG